MNRRLRTKWIAVAVFLFATLPLCAQHPPVSGAANTGSDRSGESSADFAYSEVANCQRAIDAHLEVGRRLFKAGKKLSDSESILQWEPLALHLWTVSDGFLTKFPNDPRRWQVIKWLLEEQPSFVTQIDPYDEHEPGAAKLATHYNEAAKESWKKRIEQLKEEFIAARDLPKSLLPYQAQVRFQSACDAAYEKQQAGKFVELEHIRVLFRQYLAESRDQDSQTAAVLWSEYFGLAEAIEPQSVVAAEWRQYEDDPNPKIREQVRRRLSLVRKPLELKFTALDGRSVDLEQLRGKVVLLEFWATWCGPCREEIPNLKKVYSKYRDQGFELIGISLDKAEDRDRLAKFVAENEMPWPQNFLGEEDAEKNETTRQFDVVAIPAMFLLDKEGNVADTNARGPNLEARVRELLGLAAQPSVLPASQN